MDGASIHHSKQTKTRLKEIIDLVIYLPVYALQYVPVEHYFSIFRYNLISKRSEPINLGNMIGRKEFEGALANVSQQKVVSLWKYLFTVLRQDFDVFKVAF